MQMSAVPGVWRLALQNTLLHVVRIHHPAIGWNRPTHHSGDQRRGPNFVIEDVGLLFDEHGVAGVAVAGEGDLIAHRAAWHKDGCLLAHHLGRQAL